MSRSCDTGMLPRLAICPCKESCCNVDPPPHNVHSPKVTASPMSARMESLDTWPRQHRLTADEYYRMAEVGLLAPDARVELIEGVIIDMAPIGNDHNSVVSQLTHLFVHAVGDRGVVRVQSSLRISEWSVPEPDLAILAASPDFYRKAGPTLAEMLLIVEVSDSTLAYDRDVKMPLYARHGIPETWIVDLQHNELRVYRKPQDGQYLDQHVTSAPGIVEPAALAGVAVDLSRLLTG